MEILGCLSKMVWLSNKMSIHGLSRSRGSRKITQVVFPLGILHGITSTRDSLGKSLKDEEWKDEKLRFSHDSSLCLYNIKACFLKELALLRNIYSRMNSRLVWFLCSRDPRWRKESWVFARPELWLIWKLLDEALNEQTGWKKNVSKVKLLCKK